MRISLRWLRDYAPLDTPLDLIVRTLVETGTEVGAVEPAGAGLIVARVQHLEPMPGSTHGLRLVDIDIDAAVPEGLSALGIPTRPVRLVTGAPNVSVGDLVAYAPPGARPPAMDEPLSVKTYRGRYASPGMLCSAAELGVGADAGGLLILERGVPGQPLAEVLELDTVIDVEVTTNRPDCLCHLGIARELAAALSETLSEPSVDISEHHVSAVAASQRAGVYVEDPEGCPRFAVRVLEGVQPGASPAWMQQRLRAVGLRPISNVVDVTNFVAHELGQPLHAFDLDKFVAVCGTGRADVVVRRARDGERLVTLDGVDRALHGDDIVVCAGATPVSLAGVIGGSATAVDSSTRNVLLEAASWDGVSIRATSRRLGVRTDASTLFEKGLSDTLPPPALDRAAGLIADSTGAHVLAGSVDAWVNPLPPIAPIIITDQHIARVLGVWMDATEAATVLAHLGFAVEQDGGSLTVLPPHFRRDVRLREDVVEEVGRMLGYDRVPSTLPGRRVPVSDPAPAEPLDDRVRDVCLGAGFDEAITYSFTSERATALLAGLGGERSAIPLRNPLSDEWKVMRVSQLPGLCAALALNVNRGVQSPALFELGRVFWDGERTQRVAGSTQDDGDAGAPPLPLEPLLLSVAMHAADGDRAAEALRHVQALFAWLARDIGGIELVSHPGAFRGSRAGRSACMVAGAAPLAVVAEVDPEALAAFDLRSRVVVGELNLDGVTAAGTRPLRFLPPPRFPAIVQDLAVAVPLQSRAGDAITVIRAAGGALLESVELYDEYRGGRLGEGRKGWTFRFTFRAPDRTLSGDEAQQAQAAVVRALAERAGAEVRT